MILIEDLAVDVRNNLHLTYETIWCSIFFNVGGIGSNNPSYIRWCLIFPLVLNIFLMYEMVLMYGGCGNMILTEDLAVDVS